jgi:hypothetical protein
MTEIRNAYSIFVEKPAGKRPLGRPKRRWQNSIIMDLREIGWESVDWKHVAQDRDQWQFHPNIVMKLRVP